MGYYAAVVEAIAASCREADREYLATLTPEEYAAEMARREERRRQYEAEQAAKQARREELEEFERSLFTDDASNPLAVLYGDDEDKKAILRSAIEYIK